MLLPKELASGGWEKPKTGEPTYSLMESRGSRMMKILKVELRALWAEVEGKVPGKGNLETEVTCTSEWWGFESSCVGMCDFNK